MRHHDWTGPRRQPPCRAMGAHAHRLAPCQGHSPRTVAGSGRGLPELIRRHGHPRPAAVGRDNERERRDGERKERAEEEEAEARAGAGARAAAASR